MATESEINSGGNIQDIYFYTLQPVPVSYTGYTDCLDTNRLFSRKNPTINISQTKPKHYANKAALFSDYQVRHIQPVTNKEKGEQRHGKV